MTQNTSGTNNIIQVARFILAFCWIYHGLFPKLFAVAPLEQKLTATLGYSADISYLITKTAGVGEVIFGIIILMFYRNRAVILSNIFALLTLGAMAAFYLPSILIEAFNPVSTNLAMIGLSYVLLQTKLSNK